MVKRRAMLASLMTLAAGCSSAFRTRSGINRIVVSNKDDVGHHVSVSIKDDSKVVHSQGFRLSGPEDGIRSKIINDPMISTKFDDCRIQVRIDGERSTIRLSEFDGGPCYRIVVSINGDGDIQYGYNSAECEDI